MLDGKCCGENIEQVRGGEMLGVGGREMLTGVMLVEAHEGVSVSHAGICMKRVLGEGNSVSKGPGLEHAWVCYFHCLEATEKFPVQKRQCVQKHTGSIWSC